VRGIEKVVERTESVPESEMSMRQKATQRLGKHLRWHEQESSKLIQTSSSPASVASERMFRSRETVKAWLESSPTSVLEDLDDESASPSSLESFNSSPAISDVDHLSYTTRFQNPTSKNNPPGPARVSIILIFSFNVTGREDSLNCI
jgi:hypothetical protein